MKKSFCDYCGKELTEGSRCPDVWEFRAKPHMLAKHSDTPSLGAQLRLQVGTKEVDVCRYCVLDLIASEDDRARPSDS